MVMVIVKTNTKITTNENTNAKTKTMMKTRMTKKDKCVFWELLVELDQKLATSGSKTNRAREAESCFGQMKEKHQKIRQKY